MRQALIRYFLPFCFCVLPPLAAVLVGLCIPPDARAYFQSNIGSMEMLIFGLGLPLFAVQLILSWRALQWRGTAFDDGADRWINNLAQAAEWFPILGLLGTVAGILQAFAATGAGPIQPRVIAPAITATGAGLFMAFLNILPPWIVILGRDLILTLSGDRPAGPPGAAP